MSQKVISFHYTLKDNVGQIIDSSEGNDPLAFMEGVNQIIPGLERELLTLKVGDKKKVQVAAADAYGDKNLALIIRVPKDKLPIPEVKIGDRFRGGPEEHAPVFMVTEVLAAEVVLDGNHPLAGQDLSFDVEITEIREATDDEKTHGHAHGPHGHSH